MALKRVAEFPELTFNDGVADVEVVILLVPANLGDEDGQVVVAATFDADPEAPVRLPAELHCPELQAEVSNYS